MANEIGLPRLKVQAAISSGMGCEDNLGCSKMKLVGGETGAIIHLQREEVNFGNPDVTFIRNP